MDAFEAEEIIRDYGGAVARGTDEGSVVRRAEWLPTPKARIRQAYFNLIPAIIGERGHMPQDIGQNLVNIYAMLNMFVDNETADRLTEAALRIKADELDLKSPEDKVLQDEYFNYRHRMQDPQLLEEIDSYIADCLEAA